jgi:hypothetical protein
MSNGHSNLGRLWLALLLAVLVAPAFGQVVTLLDDGDRHSDQDGCGEPRLLMLPGGVGDPDAGALPARLFVRQDATGANTGRCWVHAFTDLQDALDAARANPQVAEIWVARGTYRPDRNTGDRAASFELAPGVKLFGGFVGDEQVRAERNRDPLTNLTALSGDLAGDDVATGSKADNSLQVVDASSVSRSAVLDGFTIVGGWADGAASQSRGGGVYADLGAPTIRWCLFYDNAAFEGGAVYTNGADPKLRYCGFLQNLALDGAAIFATTGAAPDIEFSTFLNNVALASGGSVYANQAAVSILHSRLLADSAVSGGAIYAVGNSDIRAVGCVVNACAASGSGGAMALMDASTAGLVNCTVAFNTAGPLGGGVYVPDSGVVQIDNTILWGNVDASGLSPEQMQLWLGGGATALVSYSCVEEWTDALGGVGNTRANPMFMNPDGTAWADLSLAPGSACIDAGDSDAFDQVIVAMRGAAGGFYVDIDEQPRFVDDPDTVDAGTSSGGPVIDMGASEFQASVNAAGQP